MSNHTIVSMNANLCKTELSRQGVAITSRLYSEQELAKINQLIVENANLLETRLVYSIRRLLIQIPELKDVVFNEKVRELIATVGGDNFFLTKAIYFDKPKGSNWFVSYHQDLSISVAQKRKVEGYKNWTVKHDQFGVQPPIEILENTITLRIHLDDTDESNGGLKVIPRSHKMGVVRLDKKPLDKTEELACNVKKGSAMFMKPLTFHASKRSENGNRRRVIHLEFCNQELEEELQWAERIDF